MPRTASSTGALECRRPVLLGLVDNGGLELRAHHRRLLQLRLLLLLHQWCHRGGRLLVLGDRLLHVGVQRAAERRRRLSGGVLMHDRLAVLCGGVLMHDRLAVLKTRRGVVAVNQLVARQRVGNEAVMMLLLLLLVVVEMRRDGPVVLLEAVVLLVANHVVLGALVVMLLLLEERTLLQHRRMLVLLLEIALLLERVGELLLLLLPVRAHVLLRVWRRRAEAADVDDRRVWHRGRRRRVVATEVVVTVGVAVGVVLVLLLLQRLVHQARLMLLRQQARLVLLRNQARLLLLRKQARLLLLRNQARLLQLLRKQARLLLHEARLLRLLTERDGNTGVNSMTEKLLLLTLAELIERLASVRHLC